MKHGTLGNGGYFILSETRIESSATLPPFSSVGDRCVFSDYVVIGRESRIGAGCRFGVRAELRDGCYVGNGCKFDAGADVGDNVTFGDDCELRTQDMRIGVNFKFGKRFTLRHERRKYVVERMFMASNVDGSGRQCYFFLTSKGAVYVKRGCFFGTVRTFASAAKSEKKLAYVALASAAETILKAEHQL